MPKETVRVISYNIHKGFGFGNRRFVLEKIREAIRTVPAELIFLQEVLGRHDRHSARVRNWPEVSQFEYLADEIWPHFAYGKNAVYDRGHHGNAILSKYPIRSFENIDISRTRFARRGLLHAEIEVPFFKKTLHAICLHLDLTKNKRAEQGDLLAKRILAHVPKGFPLIIAGDFNDWNQHLMEELQLKLELSEAFLETTGAYARSYPAKLPTLKLDRIYFRGFRALHAECLKGKAWKRLSDHLAIYAELKGSSRP